MTTGQVMTTQSVLELERPVRRMPGHPFAGCVVRLSCRPEMLELSGRDQAG